jgi:hypothetical protein
MPIEYIHYGCKFKCGYKHTSDWVKIHAHENECWFNPKNKTCCTCKNGTRIFNNLDTQTGYDYDSRIRSFWECKTTERTETLYNELDKQYPNKKDSMFAYEYAKPCVNCTDWESEIK